MITYIIDSNVIIDAGKHYYKNAFLGFWNKIDDIVMQGRMLSVKEVYHEVKKGNDEASKWCEQNKPIFNTQTAEELAFVSTIFKTSNFQDLLDKQQRLDSVPVADPFLIAKARHTKDGCVLTNENRNTGKRVKIPIVCDHFGIDCVNLNEFMQQEGWKF